MKGGPHKPHVLQQRAGHGCHLAGELGSSTAEAQQSPPRAEHPSPSRGRVGLKVAPPAPHKGNAPRPLHPPSEQQQQTQPRPGCLQRHLHLVLTWFTEA